MSTVKTLADLDDIIEPAPQEEPEVETQEPTPEPIPEQPPTTEETETEPPAEDSLEEPEAFFSEVNRLHGVDLEIEYPENVDPLSPEGVYIRDKEIIKRTQDSFVESLKESDPRAYAYLLHRQSGGTDDSFFTVKTSVLPDYETFRNDVDLQKSVYVEYLRSRGNDQEVIDIAVDKAIKDGVLLNRATTAYESRKAEDAKILEDTQKRAEEVELETTRNLTAMNTQLDSLILESKLEGLVIPDAKRAGFKQEVLNNLYYDNGKFMLVKEVSKDNLNQILQSEYFGFVRGNLEDIVQRKAKTEQVKAVKLRMNKDTKPSKGGNDRTQGKSYIPMGDI